MPTPLEKRPSAPQNDRRRKNELDPDRHACGETTNENPGNISPIASTKTGSVSTAEIQNRRFISMNSGSGLSSSVISFGSRAMPQIGQLPGPICTISGCIGQVYSTSVGKSSFDF